MNKPEKWEKRSEKDWNSDYNNKAFCYNKGRADMDKYRKQELTELADNVKNILYSEIKHNDEIYAVDFICNAKEDCKNTNPEYALMEDLADVLSKYIKEKL